MGVTDDRNDPCIDEVNTDTGMQECYLVLSDEERAKDFVRPLRTSYVHDKCGAVTSMGLAIAETYARNPFFYGGTYCVACKDHFPVGENGEFHWDGAYDPVTGKYLTDKVGT